ncbi:hypothetical protein SEUCBS139899_008914 [Sporothrix eucalyptigena]
MSPSWSKHPCWARLVLVFKFLQILEDFLNHGEPKDMTFRRWEDGSAIAYTKLRPDFSDNYGVPYYVIHRADFHKALHSRATQLGVNVTINSRVVSYDEAVPMARTEDGREFTADLIIAADGVKSTARRVVLGGEDIAPVTTGFAAYRAVVDTSLMRNDEDISWLLTTEGLNIWIGEDRHVMTYCIAGGSLFNMVLSHIDHSDPSTWDPSTAVQDMRRYFEGWDYRLNKVISLVTKTVKWPLISASTIPTWIAPSKKLVLLGDSAHATVPYMSQGAAMAVEDGAALAEVLSSITSKRDMSKALQAYEKERMKRSYGMQTASLVNGKLWHFADGPEQRARDAGMSAEVEGRPFVESTNQWSDPTTQLWAYGYDAEEEMRKSWATVIGN